MIIATVLFYLIFTPSDSPNLLSNPTSNAVIKLTEPHLSLTLKLMEEAGLDPTLISDTTKDGVATLQLTRMIIENETKGKAKATLKSICKVNGKLVTLKALKTIVTPLIAIVDAPAAAAALAKPKARMDIINTGVKRLILSRARVAKKEYRDKRQNRERIERELANRVLPSSFSSSTDGENMELLQHWIDEIDDFEGQTNSFQESILSSRGTASLLKDDETEDDEGEPIADSKSFANVLKRFAECSWNDDAKTDYETVSIGSSYYSILLDIRDGVKQLDDQLVAALASCDTLSSLSTSKSAAYALERSRNYLYDVSSDGDNNDIAKATEKSHDLLNQLEDALNACTKFMVDDPNGLVSTLEKMRQSIHFSVDDIDVIIADWGALSRKHGINSFSLPSLQRSLRQELDGNVEAKLELPKAKAMEKEALAEFKEACVELSGERLAIASRLTQSVTERIKSLGMEGSTFQVKLNAAVHDCTDSAAYVESSILGVDTIDFMLLHRQINKDTNGDASGSQDVRNGNNDERGGNLEVVGSSGEKARILLAIETDLPGSIGASCSKISSDAALHDTIAPVAVVYDEIDAHVGGRAAVALAKLLADQTRSSIDTVEGLASRGQIICITHSPSVAAVADRHVVIQKLPMSNDLDGRVEVLVESVIGSARREELARMASGDLAPDDEGLRFADALLRQGSLHRERK